MDPQNKPPAKNRGLFLRQKKEALDQKPLDLGKYTARLKNKKSLKDSHLN